MTTLNSCTNVQISTIIVPFIIEIFYAQLIYDTTFKCGKLYLSWSHIVSIVAS